MKFFIAGDSGLLGQALVQRIAASASAHVKGVSRSAFAPTPFWSVLNGIYQHELWDLTESDEKTTLAIQSFKPDVVINAAALVNLPLCESNTILAEKLNAHLPGVLAAASRKCGARFIHISTDHVFDGNKKHPYLEEDPAFPVNQYGKTKLKGEKTALQQNQDALVIRTNIVGFRDRLEAPTFSEWICAVLWKQAPVTLFDDYITNSLHVHDLANLIVILLGTSQAGLLHLAAHEGISKFDFGEALCRALGVSFSNVTKGSLASANMSPPRPHNLSLDVAKAESLLGRRCPTVDETVQKLAADFKIRLNEVKHASRTN